MKGSTPEPIFIYRITKKKRAGDLSGQGAKTVGGRWNTKGNAAIYSSAYISLSLLEILVHTRDLYFLDYGLTIIEIPDKEKVMRFEDVNLKSLKNKSQAELGDYIFNELNAPILSVPSVIVPYEGNYVLNPHFVNDAFVLKSVEEFKIDKRLLSRKAYDELNK